MLPLKIHDEDRIIDEEALLDSGAGGLFIDDHYAKLMQIPLSRLSEPVPVYNVDRTMNKEGLITHYACLEIEIQERRRIYEFLATALGKQRLILGLPWLEEENPEVDWKKQEITWRHQTQNIYAMLHPIIDIYDQELAISYVQGKLTDQAKDDWVKTRMSHSQLFAVKEERAKEKPADQAVPKEFHEFLPTVFSEREVGTLPKRRPYDHKIDLKPDFEPKIGPLFRQSRENDELAKEFLEENLAKGFIRPSESPQAATLFFVPKKDGRVRPVQDYRYLNSGTIRNGYPLPRIDDFIDSLVGKKLFTKMDVRWGYNNVRIREGDEWKAAFICKQGLYEPTVMFFGLCNSPATFQAMMNDIFKLEIAQGWILIYMDDIIIANEGDRDDMIREGAPRP